MGRGKGDRYADTPEETKIGGLRTDREEGRRDEREKGRKKKRRRVGQEPRDELSLWCCRPPGAPSQSVSLAAVLILACLCHRMNGIETSPPSAFVLLQSSASPSADGAFNPLPCTLTLPPSPAP